MKNVKFIFFACFLAGFACCKKKDSIFKTEPTMPPITNEGKGTIGCYVNGRLWVLDGYKSYAKCEYYPWHDAPSFYGTFAVKAYCDKDESGITMVLHNRVFSKGRHFLYSSSSLDDRISYLVQLIHYANFNKVDSNNFIDISCLDTVNRIASGTFQYRVVNDNNNIDTVNVTNGRFDLRF